MGNGECKQNGCWSETLRSLLRNCLPPAACCLLFFLPSAYCLLFFLPAAFGQVRQLTPDGGLKSDPVFVDRSGAELVFVDQSDPVTMRLMRLNLSDGKLTRLHADETRAEFEPAYSLDGRYRAFVRSLGNLALALVIQDTQGGRDRELTFAQGFSGPRAPAFSPDASHVLFSFADGQQSIYSIDRDGGDQRKLIDSPGICNWPSFSPDGRQLLFASTRDGNFEIYTSQADGSQPLRLTDDLRQDLRPRFSPNGRRIVFTSNRDGNYELYVMQADGSHLRRLTSHPERDDYATWHPDGRQIVAVCERSGRQDLYLLPVPEAVNGQ
jgi:Tol biopolymer transport system component